MSWQWCCTLLLLTSSLLYVTSQTQSQPVPTPANIVCYQEVVASQGSYAQINDSLSNWSQKLYQTLGLTGPIQNQVGWARVPDRTGFENGCNGPYPNIADLFVHIQTTSSQYDSISSQLESFIAANRLTSQPNIVCSARSIVTFLPGCGKTGGAAPINNGTAAPSNATTAPPSNATTTSPPTNATSNATTLAPTTQAPTNVTNTTTAAPTTAVPTVSPSTTAPPTTPNVTINVTVNSNFYLPANITIHVNDTVFWNWTSGLHTVTSGTPGKPDGKFCSLPDGQTQNLTTCSQQGGASYAATPPYNYSHKFTTAGTYPYYCAIHQAAMTGVVNVIDASTIVGGAADQSVTGTIQYGAAQSTTSTGTWMVIPLIMTIATMFQY